jgi:predicted amidohydrolase
MKLALFQPPYPTEGTLVSAEACIHWMQEKLDGLDVGGQDLVLLPEFANAPGLADRESIRQFAAGQGADFVRAVTASAKRLQCTIVLAVVAQSRARWFNRTLVIDSKGDLVFAYDKLHLTDAERDLGLSPGTEPKVIEHAGVRLGYATCFDIYFSEHFEALAALHADIVLCPSYQRSESTHRIRIMAQARALDTGAYLARHTHSAFGGGAGRCGWPDRPEYSHQGRRPRRPSRENGL